MIEHVLIAYNDHPGEKDRRFFEDCADEVKRVIQGVAYTDISGEHLQPEVINEKVSEIEGDYIFVAASHGDAESLYNSEFSQYVSTTTNEYLFNGHIIYTIACLCGNDLGRRLVQNGAKCFWGYNNKYIFSIAESAYIETSVEALSQIISGNSMDDSYQKAMEKYDECINNCFESNYFLASQLLSNKNGLVYYHVENL